MRLGRGEMVPVRIRVAAGTRCISSIGSRPPRRWNDSVNSRPKSSARSSPPRRQAPRCAGTSSRSPSIQSWHAWSCCSTAAKSTVSLRCRVEAALAELQSNDRPRGVVWGIRGIAKWDDPE